MDDEVMDGLGKVVVFDSIGICEMQAGSQLQPELIAK
jgi:hypothetical protein